MKTHKTMDFSIVIPTKNAGKAFKQVLDAIMTQETEFSYEIICVDSGSTDDTIALIKQYPIALYEIPPQDFGHGKTRNYGASLGSGKYIVFLTQDALPAHNKWLQSFGELMESDEGIAGAFGEHFPYPDCNELDKINMPLDFSTFGNKNQVFQVTDFYRFENDVDYRRHKSFFSDNNSCIRRSVWEKYPYPDVNFAEDQLWALTILRKGYKKAYCKNAAVYHSHNYKLSTYFTRYYDEYKGLKDIYNQTFFGSFSNTKNWLKDMNSICEERLKNENVPRLKYWISYAKRRNLYKALAGYIVDCYDDMPQYAKRFFDTKVSQQYKLTHNNEKTQGISFIELKELIKWVLFKTEKQNLSDDSLKPQIKIYENYHNILDYSKKTNFSVNDYKKYKDEQIIVNWVLPHALLGSGGHINIFRMVMGAAKRGIHNRLYFMDVYYLFPSVEEYKEYLTKNFNIDCEAVEIRDDIENLEFAHATIATHWETAYIVRDFDNTISKFYFVQDFEPMFFAAGTKYGLALNTYKFGFRGITAGYWLAKKLKTEFGMETEGYGFSVDRSIYKPMKKTDDIKRIFMYARPFTERRAFDFGVIVLSKLHRKMPDVEIVFAGEDTSNYQIDFPYVNRGVLSEKDLPSVYSQCDICIVFSMTNASLLPVDIMACNSVVLCNDDDNNKWLTNETNSILVDFDVDKTVETIEYYLTHPKELEEKRIAGMEYANNTSWEKSVEIVYNTIINGVNEDMNTLENKLK